MSGVSLNTNQTIQEGNEQSTVSSQPETKETSSGSLGGDNLRVASAETRTSSSESTESDGVEDPDESEVIDIAAEIASETTKALYTSLTNIVAQSMAQTRSSESVQSEWSKAQSHSAPEDPEFKTDMTTGRQTTRMGQSGEGWRNDELINNLDLLNSKVQLQPLPENQNRTSVSGMTGVNTYEA
ncbi:hypothetical protein AB1L42_01460 [Thalassoglobus sp. JC818]|uniref:hypothetical protein n=1 Tax=Thalassoglobus sp. JC818 TaxID=3232136 RepID=UPI00345A49E6